MDAFHPGKKTLGPELLISMTELAVLSGPESLRSISTTSLLVWSVVIGEKDYRFTISNLSISIPNLNLTRIT